MSCNKGLTFNFSNKLLFQISHNCVTECMLQAKFFVKTYLKAIRDTFFPSMWNFRMWYFYPAEGESLSCRLAGRPPSPVPSFSETSWSPHDENPEGSLSASCNDFLSKQNIYSMLKTKTRRQFFIFWWCSIYFQSIWK